MKFFATSANAGKHQTACAIVGIYDRKQLTRAAEEVNRSSRGMVKRVLDRGDTSGKLGKTLLLTDTSRAQPVRVILVGLGKKSKFGPRAYRQAVTAAVRVLLTTGAADAVSFLGREIAAKLGPYGAARIAVQELGTAMYRFSAFKSGPKPRAHKLKKFGLGAEDDSSDATMRGVRHADGIVQGMNLTRNLGNTPPNVCTPSYLVDQARELAQRYSKVDIQVLDEPDMQELGMGSLLSVAHGSAEPAHLIVLEYRGGVDGAAPIALVGKGITFDTGGTSLKPGPAMDEMKYDMCGAASVLGTLASAAALKLPVNLLVVVATAENMPGSRASRPGDIVTSMSGKTIEILNTDAEGRLILCDALTYARQYDPSAIVDVATLTGACVIALGRHFSGLLSNSDSLSAALLDAGDRADDGAWRLPIDERYGEQLRSNFADMANIGGREAGAITAACFLGKFTDGVDWAHIDIAGTAYLSGAKKGGTGRPVPLLTDYLINASGVPTN